MCGSRRSSCRNPSTLFGSCPASSRSSNSLENFSVVLAFPCSVWLDTKNQALSYGSIHACCLPSRPAPPLLRWVRPSDSPRCGSPHGPSSVGVVRPSCSTPFRSSAIATSHPVHGLIHDRLRPIQQIKAPTDTLYDATVWAGEILLLVGFGASKGRLHTPPLGHWALP